MRTGVLIAGVFDLALSETAASALLPDRASALFGVGWSDLAAGAQRFADA